MTWCYVPGTDCPSAQAAEAWIWASCWPNPASTRDALSSGRITPGGPSSPPSGPDTLPRPRSGMMSPPLTGGPSVARSTPSLPDTPVSPSAWQDSAKEPTTSGTCGPMLPGSSAKSNPDGSFSKTSPGTSPSVLKPFCATYGDWVSRLRLAYSRRAKLARRMKGSACSSWPTATPMQTRDGWTADELGARRAEVAASAKNGNGFGLGLGAAATSWTTPQAHDTTPRGKGQQPTAKAGNACLARDAEVFTQWGAPRASDAEKGGPNQAFGAGGIPLPAQAAQWPTPAARDRKGENSADHLENGTGRLHLDQLPNFVAHCFSRPAPETVTHGPTLSQLRRIWRPLRASLIASHGRATWRRLWKSRDKKRLNPLFVEWLMAWPSGHALCDCSATEFTRWQQDMRGALSRLPTASAPWIWAPKVEAKAPEQMDLWG